MKNIWNKFTDLFGKTIFHPQYIMNNYCWEAIKIAVKVSHGKSILDIGCGRMIYKEELLKTAEKYFGVDHPSISQLYKASIKPDLLADAENIPVKSSSYETVLLLQVLEYIKNPNKAINEAQRIVKKNGYIIITSPFMYPIHDGELDRSRFTASHLKSFFNPKNFSVKIVSQGGFFDFTIQNLLVFWFKAGLKSPLILVPSPIIVPILNLSAIALRPIGSLFSSNNDFPLNYLVIAKKK